MGHFFPVVFVFWDSHTTEEMFFVRGFFFLFFWWFLFFRTGSAQRKTSLAPPALQRNESSVTCCQPSCFASNTPLPNLFACALLFALIVSLQICCCSC